MQLNKNKKVGKNSGPLLVSCLFFLLPLDRNRSGKFHFIVWHLKSFAWHGVTIKLDCYLNFDLAGFLVRFGTVWFGLVWFADWLDAGIGAYSCCTFQVKPFAFNTDSCLNLIIFSPHERIKF